MSIYASSAFMKASLYLCLLIRLHQLVVPHCLRKSIERGRVAPRLLFNLLFNSPRKARRPLSSRKLASDGFYVCFGQKLRVATHVVYVHCQQCPLKAGASFSPNSVASCTSCPILEIVPVSPGSWWRMIASQTLSACSRGAPLSSSHWSAMKPP